MSEPIRRGKFGEYSWVESPKLSPGKIFSALQNDILQTTMVVATFDSGSINPNEAERKLGWFSQSGALYAPKLEDVESIPWENCDEIYFYDKDPIKIEYKRFVNIGMFSLVDPGEKLKSSDSTWDLIGIKKYGEVETENQSKLKAQILHLQPKVVLLNGDNVILIYRENDIGTQVKNTILKMEE